LPSLPRDGLNALEREPDNKSDRYTVAVNKDGIIVGHFP